MRIGLGVREGGGWAIGGRRARLQLAVKDASRRGAFSLVVREEAHKGLVCIRGAPRAYRHMSVHRGCSNGVLFGVPPLALFAAAVCEVEGEEGHESDEEHDRDDDEHNHGAGLVA